MCALADGRAGCQTGTSTGGRDNRVHAGAARVGAVASQRHRPRLENVHLEQIEDTAVVVIALHCVRHADKVAAVPGEPSGRGETRLS